MKKITLCSALFFLCTFLFSDELVYRYDLWKDYKIITETVEDVYLNDQYFQKGYITGKASFTFEGMEGEWAEYSATLFNLEKTHASWGEVLEINEEHQFHFFRDTKGYMEMDPPSLYPVLRNLLVLPQGLIRPGQTWEATGTEQHDGSMSFSVDHFSFPRKVLYTYRGEREYNGETYHLIETESRFNVYPELSGEPWGYTYPRQVEGVSSRKIYWEIDQGRPAFIEESFIIALYLADLQEVVYDGQRISRYEYVEELDREQEMQEIQEILEEQGIGDTEISSDDEGMILTLNQIHFYPDSPVMLPEEKERIEALAEILSRFPTRDILITGHTADFGLQDKQFQLELSLERSQTVVEKLQAILGDRPGLFITRGMGGTEPVADNQTEEGRSRNRRVEIKVLDN